MKASKEIKQWINKARSDRGKRNGVVRWLMESKTALKIHTHRRAIGGGSSN